MAQVSDTITAKPRQASTKSAARKVRAAGWVPATAYGPGAATQSLSVEPKTFMNARRFHGAAHIYKIDVDGGDGFKALVKKVEVDPVSNKLLHLDLYAIDMNQPIKVAVRLELTGKAKGLIDGGIVQQALRRLEVICLPADMPGKLVVDVSEMAVGDVLHISDLNLPQGVKPTALSDEAVVGVAAPDAEEEAKTAAGAEGEATAAADGAAGDAAAPAADASAEKKKEG